MSTGLRSTVIKHLSNFIPDELQGLVELALDLRYTWGHSADNIWNQLNPELWAQTHNPWLVLQSAPEKNLNALVKNEQILKQIDDLLTKENDLMHEPGWFEQNYPGSPIDTIAYFSMEFGLSESLPIYSGGLGLLAGDHLKAAHDLRVPLIGIGILYQNGYFRQSFDAEGKQIALYPNSNLYELPVTPVRDDSGGWLRLDLQLPGQKLKVRVWQAAVGRVTLYLLDTNDPVNEPVARCITTELYGGGQEQRLQQEILLGIGGWRVLQALKIHPQVCHLNEGHAAFAVLDRARSFMKQHDVDFNTAFTITRAGNLFTTHTPVEAGFDRFPAEMINRYFAKYADNLSISIDELLALGQNNSKNKNSEFNMAFLAMRGSCAMNGVSQLHGRVSQKIFSQLFPGWPIEEVPVGYVTNGVHVPTWDSARSDKLWTDVCGRNRWVGDFQCLENKFKETSDLDLWILRMYNRKALVDFVREEKLRQYEIGGLSHEESVDQARILFDPNTLTLGFARRFAAYKRPDLLLQDPERFIRILTHSERPVQIVIAGKAHPADGHGQEMLRKWHQFIQRPEVMNHVVFINDYNMHVASHLVAGVDVWINNPRRPWEASGTSGMKILVNGGLNLSELDGWWAEAYSEDVGWAIGDGREHNSDPAWDTYEAEQIYQLLENKVVPEFYDRNEQGIPVPWLVRMRASMTRLTPYYSTNRMIQQYLDQYYIPCAENYRIRCENEGKIGIDLKNWFHQIEYCWPTIHFGEIKIETVENKLFFNIPVYLGEVDSEHIHVELYAQPLNDDQPVVIEMRKDHELAGSCNSYMYATEVNNVRDANDYTVRIRAYHPNAIVPIECRNILWHK